MGNSLVRYAAPDRGVSLCRIVLLLCGCMSSSPPKTVYPTGHRNLPIASSLIREALSGREAIAASREDQLIALGPRSVCRKKTILLAGWLRRLYREHLSLRGCEGVHRAAAGASPPSVVPRGVLGVPAETRNRIRQPRPMGLRQLYRPVPGLCFTVPLGPTA